MLVMLAFYGLVAVLLTPGTALALRIIPSLGLGLLTLAAVFWAGSGRTIAAAEPICSHERHTLLALLGLGVILRIGCWAVVQPVPFSDFASYFKSAVHLWQFHVYRVPEPEGLLKAYRPPGTAFLLALVMGLVGPTAWSPLVLNTICFVTTASVLWHCIRPRVTMAAATGALALFTIWPSDVLYAGLPQSESPTLLCVSLLTYLVLKRDGRLIPWAAQTGLVTGVACLIRNSTLVLMPLWVLHVLKEAAPFRTRLRACVVLTILTLLPILPWTWRNYRQLGAPVLVATNGGENLYSANNDNADGSWNNTHEVRIYLPDELTMDQVAKAKAIDWIRSHPSQFLRLSVAKFRILMTRDDQGVYHVLERGAGYTGPAISLLQILSNCWWLLLWALVLIALRYRKAWEWDQNIYELIALAVVPALLFLVFQSQARYHMPMIPPLLMLVGYALSSRRTTLTSSAPSHRPPTAPDSTLPPSVAR